ncbi:hypothetical protein GCM10027615_50560 [Plantactinospora veratri]
MDCRTGSAAPLADAPSPAGSAGIPAADAGREASAPSPAGVVEPPDIGTPQTSQ